MLFGSTAFAEDPLSVPLQTPPPQGPSQSPPLQKSDISISQEATVSASATGGAHTSFGGNGFHTVSEQEDFFHYVVSPEVTPTFLPRIGVEWQRYSFGLPDTHVPLPNTLQSVSAVLGFDYSIGDHWLIRLEAQPGIYGDFYSTGSQNFNVPVILGGSYLVNENLQMVLGVSIDPWRKIPVLPGAGVRWQFDPKWCLDFILPQPRLEYEVTKDLHTYIGAEIQTGTYRVGPTFGNQFGQPGMNGAIIEYTEGRAGGGLSWKFTPGFNLEAEGGMMLERSFDYSRAGDRVGSDPAPYCQIAFKASY